MSWQQQVQQVHPLLFLTIARVVCPPRLCSAAEAEAEAEAEADGDGNGVAWPE